MAIVASGQFPDSEFSEKAREAARRFQARMAKHSSAVDLTRDATLGLHSDVMSRTVAGFESLRQIALFMSIAQALRELDRLHPGVGPFLVAPDPEPGQDLTIVALEAGLLGAIVLPCMSRSLGKQVASAVRRLAGRNLQHRYVFFVPLLGRNEAEGRVEKYEKGGVQVWSMYA